MAVVAPAEASTFEAHAPALAASVTLTRTRPRAAEAVAEAGIGPMLTPTWPPNHGSMSPW